MINNPVLESEAVEFFRDGFLTPSTLRDWLQDADPDSYQAVDDQFVNTLLLVIEEALAQEKDEDYEDNDGGYEDDDEDVEDEWYLDADPEDENYFYLDV